MEDINNNDRCPYCNEIHDNCICEPLCPACGYPEDQCECFCHCCGEYIDECTCNDTDNDEEICEECNERINECVCNPYPFMSSSINILDEEICEECNERIDKCVCNQPVLHSHTQFADKYSAVRINSYYAPINYTHQHRVEFQTEYTYEETIRVSIEKGLLHFMTLTNPVNKKEHQLKKYWIIPIKHQNTENTCPEIPKKAQLKYIDIIEVPNVKWTYLLIFEIVDVSRDFNI